MKKSSQYVVVGVIGIISSFIIPFIVLVMWILIKEPQVTHEQRWVDGWKTFEVTRWHPGAPVLPYIAVFGFIILLALGFFCFYEAHKAEEVERPGQPSGFCLSCGAKLAPEGDFCIRCGRKITSG